MGIVFSSFCRLSAMIQHPFFGSSQLLKSHLCLNRSIISLLWHCSFHSKHQQKVQKLQTFNQCQLDQIRAWFDISCSDLLSLLQVRPAQGAPHYFHLSIVLNPDTAVVKFEPLVGLQLKTKSNICCCSAFVLIINFFLFVNCTLQSLHFDCSWTAFGFHSTSDSTNPTRNKFNFYTKQKQKHGRTARWAAK